MNPWKTKALLLFGTAIWGATFMFTKVGIEHCSPTLYIILRFCIAILLTYIFFGKHLIKKISKKIIKQSAILGLFFACGFLLQTFGLKYTSVNNSAFITELTVVVTPFVFWFIARQKIKFSAKIAIFLGLLGVIIMTKPDLNNLNTGDLLTLFSTIFWALYIIYIDIFTKNTKELALNVQFVAMQFITGLPLLILYFLLFERNNFYLNINSELIFSILFNGIMASFLVSFIQISVQKYTNPVSAALIFALEPVFACVISFFVLGEILSLHGYIGAGIMLLAVFLVDISDMFKKPKPKCI